MEAFLGALLIKVLNSVVLLYLGGLISVMAALIKFPLYFWKGEPIKGVTLIVELRLTVLSGVSRKSFCLKGLEYGIGRSII
jgi:hypothetical protein